jgi:hypothetical protein
MTASAWQNTGSNCRDSISTRVFANLFLGTLPRQSLLYSALIARLQVEGVTLHFLNNVLGLHFALESTKSILDRFALLQSNFCHAHHPPTTTQRLLHFCCFPSIYAQ